MFEHGNLRLEHAPRLGGVRDLEDNGRLIATRYQKILIALACEPARDADPREMIAREPFGGIGVEAWAMVEQVRLAGATVAGRRSILRIAVGLR